MKISITISDAEPWELEKLLQSLNNGTAITTGAVHVSGEVSQDALNKLVQQTSTVGQTTDTSNDDEGPANGAAPAFDSAGLPWDARIHAKTKALLNNGQWRQRRNVDQALVTQVEAELRAHMGANGTAPQNGPGPMPHQQPQPGPSPMPHEQVHQPQGGPAGFDPSMFQMPGAGGAPQPGPAFMDGQAFMTHLSGKMSSGAMDINYLVTVAQRLNQQFPQMQPITNITEIMNDQVRQPAAQSIMLQDGRW